MSKKSSDLKFGFDNEKTVLPIIKKFFKDDNIKMYVDKFEVIDFKSDNLICELKSRRINHDQYDTCLFGFNKYEEFKNNNIDSYICYKYIDGLFYIKYDENKFNTYENKIQNVWRDGRCEKSRVLLIPIKDLIPLIISS